MSKSENAPNTYKTAALVATYEELLDIPQEQQTTYYFGDYGGHFFEYGITQEQKNAAYDKALAAIELDSDSYQSGFVYRGETIVRMRACLLAEELKPGEKVLFIPNEPIAENGNFAYELGTIIAIDKVEKSFTAQADNGQLSEGQLGYVLARHNPASPGIHFGRECAEPLLGLHDTMAQDFLSMTTSKWQEAQKTPSIAMTM